MQQQNSSIVPSRFTQTQNRYRTEPKNINTLSNSKLAGGIVGTSLLGTSLLGTTDNSKSIDTKQDINTNIKTSNDLKIDYSDKNKLKIPTNTQASFDDIIANTRGKIDNQKFNNNRDKNYKTKYNNWKNKYYRNRGWKYRQGYWDNNSWIDGYWYYNPYLFYPYLDYPYPNLGYYYLEYPYLDYPITNIEESQLDTIQSKINEPNNNELTSDNNELTSDNNELTSENNSEEFNKFLLDELIRLRIKLDKLEKNKQEKDNEISKDTILNNEFNVKVETEINNLDNSDDVPEEILKFIGSQINEESNKLTNYIETRSKVIEKFTLDISDYLPLIIIILIILFILYCFQ